MRTMALQKQRLGMRQRSADSGVDPDRSLLSKEQRDQRISLFLHDFDQQGELRGGARGALQVAVAIIWGCPGSPESQVVSIYQAT